MDPLKQMFLKMEEIISFIKEEFSKIRSNRPTTRLVEHIKVSYMGAEIKLIHIATINVNPPKDIIVSPWDKNAIASILKAIEESGMGLGISADNNGIRLTVPDLTKERKQELVKFIKSIAHENEIKMRAARDKTVKELNNLPEDQKFKNKEALQKLVDKFNGEVERLVKEKIIEIEG